MVGYDAGGYGACASGDGGGFTGTVPLKVVWMHITSTKSSKHYTRLMVIV